MRIGAVYTYRCKSCGSYLRKFVSEHSKGAPFPCIDCGSLMNLVETPKRMYSPFTPYYNKQLDQKFYTRDEERSYTKKNGLIDITGEHKAARSGRGGWRNKLD